MCSSGHTGVHAIVLTAAACSTTWPGWAPNSCPGDRVRSPAARLRRRHERDEAIVGAVGERTVRRHHKLRLGIARADRRLGVEVERDQVVRHAQPEHLEVRLGKDVVPVERRCRRQKIRQEVVPACPQLGKARELERVRGWAGDRADAEPGRRAAALGHHERVLHVPDDLRSVRRRELRVTYYVAVHIVAVVGHAPGLRLNRADQRCRVRGTELGTGQSVQQTPREGVGLRPIGVHRDLDRGGRRIRLRP